MKPDTDRGAPQTPAPDAPAPDAHARERDLARLQSLDNPEVRVVTLDEPITRGEAPRIETLTIRKPDAGSLRGVSLMALVQIDVAALTAVLPRICEPILTRAEIARLDAADLMAIGSTVASFFLSRADRQALGLSTG